jgi:hypothetical protein
LQTQAGNLPPIDLGKFKLVKKKRMCYPEPEFEPLATESISSVSVLRSKRTYLTIGISIDPKPCSPVKQPTNGIDPVV